MNLAKEVIWELALTGWNLEWHECLPNRLYPEWRGLPGRLVGSLVRFVFGVNNGLLRSLRTALSRHLAILGVIVFIYMNETVLFVKQTRSA